MILEALFARMLGVELKVKKEKKSVTFDLQDLVPFKN